MTAIAIAGLETSEGAALPSLSELEERAGRGDLSAALSLGMRYRDGKGVDRDYSEAMKWYRFSADKGDADGMDNVGYLFLRGWGVPQDSGIAVAYFRSSFEKGHAQGGYNLGECYFSGRGVEQDYGKAFETWNQAAKSGHQNSKWRVAMMLASGEGVPRDLDKAKALCHEIADKGHSHGMLLLGEILDREGNHEEARQWWQRAADRNNTQGKDLLELSKWRHAKPVPGERAFVEVDHIYQGWNNCGSTSVSMFLRQAGGKLTPYDVKRFCPQSPIGTGTDWSHLLEVAPKTGQDWKMVTFANDETGFEKGVIEIRDLLDEGQPVVIDFTVTKVENGKTEHYGHTLLVVGYDTESDRFVLKNPNQPSPGIQMMTSDELKENWHSKGYSYTAKGKAARPLIVHTGE